jgi:hypothetical protein
MGNVKLGAKERRRPFSNIVTEFPLPEDFPQHERDMLVLSLRQFLYRWIAPFQTSGPRPTAQQLPDIAELLVCVYQFARAQLTTGFSKASRYSTARILYVSLLDDSMLTGRVRVKDRWNSDGNSRYDYVLFNLDHKTYGYGQVRNLFSIVVNKVTYSIALLLELKKRSRCKTTGFIQTSANPLKASSYRFVMVDTLVRPALVHPPAPNSKDTTKHVVNDLIDYDMYLRLLHVG